MGLQRKQMLEREISEFECKRNSITKKEVKVVNNRDSVEPKKLLSFIKVGFNHLDP